MVDYTETFDASVVAHASLALNASTSGELDVSALLSGVLQIFAAPIGTTANASGMDIYVEVTGHATAHDQWIRVAEFKTSTIAASLVNVNASEAAGETEITVDGITGMDARDFIYIQDTTTIADSEWHRLMDAESTSLFIEGGLQNAKDSSDDVFDQAFVAALPMDLAGVRRVRVTFNHRVSATGSTMHVLSLMSTADAIE